VTQYLIDGFVPNEFGSTNTKVVAPMLFLASYSIAIGAPTCLKPTTPSVLTLEDLYKKKFVNPSPLIQRHCDCVMNLYMLLALL
jgi:hypothetical protein